MDQERKRFDFLSVLRILETIWQQYPGETQACQDAAHRRLAIMGIPVDLEETQRQHRTKAFHDDAEIIVVADDGMRFTRFNGSWIIGNEYTGYLVFRVTPEHIEQIFEDKSIKIIRG